MARLLPLEPPDSTTTLIERARAGDRAAADALFARCWPPLLRWARATAAAVGPRPG